MAKMRSHLNPVNSLKTCCISSEAAGPRPVMLRSTPRVAAENSVRVLPWHSIRLASESRNKPHPHHSLSEHPQPISVAVVEHSAIEQTQGASCAVLDM